MYLPVTSWANRNFKTQYGYILVEMPEHPKAFNGWYYEHRLVIESHLDRILETWETVHHINEIKTDNSLSNLFLCTKEQHYKAHQSKDVS